MVILLAVVAGAQATPLHKAIALGRETVYLSPDLSSSKVGGLQPGEQIGVQATGRGFTQIFSGVSGWIPDHDYVQLSAPNAASVLLGAAVKQERLGEQNNDDTATAAAVRLFLDIYNYLPESPRAAEALYRGAALRWETKISEEPLGTAPSNRLFPDDSLLHKVENRYRNTPWAAQAAFQLIIEHFTCGDWFQKPSCIGKEAKRYQDYVKKYPSSPSAPEAAFDALYRDGIAWTIYRRASIHQDAGKAAQFQQQVALDAVQLQQQYPHSDWAARGAYLAYLVAHNSPLPLPASTPLGGP